MVLLAIEVLKVCLLISCSCAKLSPGSYMWAEAAFSECGTASTMWWSRSSTWQGWRLGLLGCLVRRPGIATKWVCSNWRVGVCGPGFLIDKFVVKSMHDSCSSDHPPRTNKVMYRFLIDYYNLWLITLCSCLAYTILTLYPVTKIR